VSFHKLRRKLNVVNTGAYVMYCVIKLITAVINSAVSNLVRGTLTEGEGSVH
jgi:hypothetical protein